VHGLQGFLQFKFFFIVATVFKSNTAGTISCCQQTLLSCHNFFSDVDVDVDVALIKDGEIRILLEKMWPSFGFLMT
jgi:hypothetical protein